MDRSRVSLPARLDAAGKAIQRKAAEWLALREARGFTLSEQTDFAEWIAKDPRHAAIFTEVEASWRIFDRLQAYPHSDDLSPDPDLLLPTRGHRPQSRVRVFLIGLAAAAAVAMTTAMWFKTRSHSESTATPPALAETGSRFVNLPDGSVVELKGNSAVREHYMPGKRRVELVRGEAHFAVAKDERRPFIVEANGIAVRAVGTAFNVRMDPEAVEVLVTEGTVQVAPLVPTRSDSRAPGGADDVRAAEAASATLIVNQRTVLPTRTTSGQKRPAIETLTAADVDRALAWQSSLFTFDDTPLAEVVARFSRYAVERHYQLRLAIADEQLGALRISGRVRGDNIGSFLEVLESASGVKVECRSHGEFVLRDAAALSER